MVSLRPEPHFTASITQNLVKDRGENRHFTTAYCPWANCTAERLRKEVIRAVKACSSE